MKTLSTNFISRSFCLLIASAFCLAGCSSPEPETSTPQKKEGGVVEMKIQTSDDESATEDKEEATKGSATEETVEPKSSGLSLTPPKS